MSDIRKILNLLRNMTKYGIFALTLICIVYCGLMYFGYDYFGIHLTLFGFALSLRLILSKVFGLYWVHRLCIIYIFLISFCVATLRHNIFNILGVDIKLIEGLLFGMGILLIPLTFWKLKNKNC